MGAASGIEGLGTGGAFARFAAGCLGAARFQLIDVGCAGGLAPGWRVFGDHLVAVGIDGNAAEVERLAAEEANPNVRYVCGLAGLPDDHPLRTKNGGKAYWHHWPALRMSWERTLCLRRGLAEGLQPKSLDAYFREDVLGQDWLTTPAGGFDLDYAADFAPPVFDAPLPSDASVVHLPDLARAAGLTDLDFLKIDIDGPDYEVLRSAGSLLEQPGLLGVAVEVSFFGSHDANDNTFHNVDRLMRQKGFDLFALSKRAYSSAALPWPYLDDQPGKTLGGRPAQGDAIYLRDLGSRVRAAEAAAVDDAKLLKTAILLSLMELHDWAAEVLLAHAARLSALIDVPEALDLLAQDIQRGRTAPLSFQGYVAQFEAEAPWFFGAGAGVTQTAAPPEGISGASDARVVALEHRLRVMESSASWRLTAPFRRMAITLRRARIRLAPAAPLPQV